MAGRVLVFVQVLVLFAMPSTAQQKALSRHEKQDLSHRGKLLAENILVLQLAQSALNRADPAYSRDLVPIGRKQDGRWVVLFGTLNETRDAFLTSYQAIESSGNFNTQHFPTAKPERGYFLFAARAMDQSRASNPTHSVTPQFTAMPADNGEIYVYGQPSRTLLGDDSRDLYTSDGLFIVERRVMHRHIVPTVELAFPVSLKPSHHARSAQRIEREESNADKEPCSFVLDVRGGLSDVTCEPPVSGLGEHSSGWEAGDGDSIKALHDGPEDSDIAFAVLRKHPAVVSTPKYSYWITPDGKIKKMSSKRRS